MGCGKTTLGKKLAKKLQFNFIDIDSEIEKKENRTISEIFASDGEDEFRKIETELLVKCSFENTVVSTGGGLPCFNDNLRFMNERGVSIFLQRPAKELFHRLKNSKTTRPLLHNLQDDEMLEYIERMLVERNKFYQQAMIICDRNAQNPKEIIEAIRAYQDRQKSL